MMKALSYLVVFVVLMSMIQPILASDELYSQRSAKVAYIHGYSSEMEDELYPWRHVRLVKS